MREIKFRAWHKNSKCWINDEVFLDLNSGKFLCGTQQEDMWELEDYENLIEVMQFTGLIWDMEKEIYEGDIIKTSKGVVGKIVYELGQFIIVSNKFEDSYEFLSNYHAEDSYCDLEVIGNIYENPELLEDK